MVPSGALSTAPLPRVASSARRAVRSCTSSGSLLRSCISLRRFGSSSNLGCARNTLSPATPMPRRHGARQRVVRSTLGDLHLICATAYSTVARPSDPRAVDARSELRRRHLNRSHQKVHPWVFVRDRRQAPSLCEAPSRTPPNSVAALPADGHGARHRAYRFCVDRPWGAHAASTFTSTYVLCEWSPCCGYGETSRYCPDREHGAGARRRLPVQSSPSLHPLRDG